MKIIDPTRKNLELLLQDEVVVSPPDPDGSGDIGGSDPLAVRGEPSECGRVSVLGVDGDLERVIEVEEDDGSAICVQNCVGFRIAGDENSSATLRRRHASVGLGELWHFLSFFFRFLWGKKIKLRREKRR